MSDRLRVAIVVVAFLMSMLVAALVSAQDVPARSDPVVRVSFISTCALAMADAAMTADAIARNRAEEANPLLRPFVGRPVLFGLVKGAGDGLMLWSVAHADDWFESRWKRYLFVFSLLAGKALVVAWNARELGKAGVR